MKIAILNMYSGLVNRGAESVAHNLAIHLGSRHQVTLYQGGPQSTSTPYSIVSIPNISIIPTDPGSSIINRLNHRLYRDAYNQQVSSFTSACLPFLANVRPDAVISFNGYNQLKLLQQQQRHTPFHLIHTNQSAFHPSLFKLAGYDNYRKLSLKPDAFICLTPDMYTWSKSYASPATHVVHIPNGVDTESFNPDVKPARLTLQPPVILCVAGLQAYKRIHLAIAAVSQLPQASLLVIGTGPLESKLHTLGLDSLGPNRFQILSVAHHDMPYYYAAAHAFTLPSEPLEAFGVAYLEAMATNRPVVAPDDATRRYIVGQGGLCVSVTNTSEYAHALAMAISTSWSDHPRQQALQFSWDKIASQYEQLLQTL